MNGLAFIMFLISAGIMVFALLLIGIAALLLWMRARKLNAPSVDERLQKTKDDGNDKDI